LTAGPGADIFFPNINLGTVSRISYCEGCANVAPSAAIALDEGSVADGPPRTITFTAANSVDPDHDEALTYDWDLDGDGVFGDASGVTAFRFYPDEGSFRVAVRVSDIAGASDVQSMLVTVVGDIATVDVGVTLDDGIGTVFVGDVVTYTMVVTNDSDTAVVGELVATTLSPMLRNPEWTCIASAGASCVATGSGDVDDAVDLEPGASVTYTIEATVDSGASGTLDSAAHVTSPPGYQDPNGTNDAASDSDTIISDRIFADGFDAG
jgi:uncharacterized repeat protein (TIGR01451 family)